MKKAFGNQQRHVAGIAPILNSCVTMDVQHWGICSILRAVVWVTNATRRHLNALAKIKPEVVGPFAEALDVQSCC
jgi:hypothetical protein